MGIRRKIISQQKKVTKVEFQVFQIDLVTMKAKEQEKLIHIYIRIYLTLIVKLLDHLIFMVMV
jgi:hypothetical protein